MCNVRRIWCDFTGKLMIATVVALSIIGHATAEGYPVHPIKIVVPFPAGGPTDVVCRIVAERMRDSLGQPVIVENISGASGSIGVDHVAHAAPDGYTLSFGNWSTHVVNGAMMAVRYDPIKDFAPIALVSDNKMMIVAKKTMPANDLKELIAWLKANPNAASQGTPGVGTAPHLAGIVFQNMTGTQFQSVAYRGVGPAIQDLIAGRIDLMFDFVTNSLPQLHAGTVKAYAVLSKNRLPSVPDIPTVDEIGLPGLYVSSWQAIWAPKGTPKAVIAKLNAAVVESLADGSVRARLAALGQEIFPPEMQTSEALRAFHRTEIEKWWPIIKQAGLRHAD